MNPIIHFAPATAARRGAVATLVLCALVCHGAARAQAPAPAPAFTPLKYADSLTSVNDRCVITHNRLNPAMHPLYVNGQPVGFC